MGPSSAPTPLTPSKIASCAQPLAESRPAASLSLPQPPVSLRGSARAATAGPARSTLPCPAIQLTHVHGYNGVAPALTFCYRAATSVALAGRGEPGPKAGLHAGGSPDTVLARRGGQPGAAVAP